MNRIIKEQDIVYVVMSPSGATIPYRSIKCYINKIYYRRTTLVDRLEYDDSNIPADYRISLINAENPKARYTKKNLDKIYFEDEKDKMQVDIDNLNKILQFKIKQKQELENYINREFYNWIYKGSINI